MSIQPPVRFRVVRWYDRRTRNWVVQVKDAHNNQVGDAEYSATELEARRSQTYWYNLLSNDGRVVLEKLQPIYA